MEITKKYPLTILIHLRIINLACLNLACLKQRFNDCLFQVSFCLYNLFIIYNLLYQSLNILHFTNVARSLLKDIKKQ